MSDEPSSVSSAPQLNKKQPDPRKGRKGFRRASLELAALATCKWLIFVLIRPETPEINVVPFGLKWFFFTYGRSALILLLPFLLLFAVGALGCLALRNTGYWTVYRFAFVIAAIWMVLGNYGLWYSRNARIDVGLRNFNTLTSSTVAPVIVADTIQGYEGVTQTDLDINFLTNVEAWLVSTVKAKLAQGGFNPDNSKFNISSRASYVEIDGKRLGIIKMSVFDTRAVYVVGVAGTEFHRISCLRKSPHEILVMSGVCGAKIRDVFRVNLPISLRQPNERKR